MQSRHEYAMETGWGSSLCRFAAVECRFMSSLLDFVRRHPGLAVRELAKAYAKEQGIHENAALSEIEGARRNQFVRELRHASGNVLIYRNFQLRRGNR